MKSTSLSHVLLGLKYISIAVFLVSVLLLLRPRSNSITPKAEPKLSSDILARLNKPRSRLFNASKPFVIWTMDMHVSTIGDMRHRLEPMGVKFIEKSLSMHCQPDRCAHDLKIISRTNAFDLTPKLIERFYQAYKDDEEMRSVDAFMCFHPPSLCELFMPFKKSIIVVASLRYELGRHKPREWKSWNRNLQTISKDPLNVVAANNLYDAEYIKYFTGIQTRVLPSYCGYINESYNPTRPEFLLFAGRGLRSTFSVIFMRDYNKTCQEKKLKCPTIYYTKDYFANVGGYSYRDLTSFQALIHAPYQVSVMSFFEQYRLNVPLFFPSLSLMAKWEHQRTWLKERIFHTIRTGLRPNGSDIRPHHTQLGIPDPNTVEDPYAISYWIKFSDFYQWPYITYYDSYEDLIDKLHSVDLAAVSRKMMIYNVRHRQRLDLEWKKILFNMASKSKTKSFW